MQSLLKYHCGVTSIVASKSTGVMRDSDSLLGRGEKQESAITKLGTSNLRLLQTSQAVSAETAPVQDRPPLTERGFNYSWEIPFGCRTHNSCIITLIKMDGLDLFSHKTQPDNLSKKFLFSIQVLVRKKKKKEKKAYSVYHLLTELRIIFGYNIKSYYPHFLSC